MTLTIGRARTSNLIQNTPEWEEARKRTIGSSTIPVLTGNSPYDTSPIAVWSVMTGQLEADPIDPETQAMFDLGHALEDDIADAYTRHTGRRLKRVRHQLHHPDVEWATASLDRVSAVKGERIIVEIKWEPHARAYGQGEDLVPPHVADQCQWQMLVTGYPIVHVAVLSGSRFSWYEVKADAAYQDDLLFIARDFMDRVERREMPPIDGRPATTRTLGRLYPEDNGELVEPTLELDAMAERLRVAKVAAKAAEAEEAEAANGMRLALGDAAGVKTDRYRVTWTTNKPSTRVDWEGVAHAVAALLTPEPNRAIAEVIGAHTTTTPGARVMRSYFLDDEKGRWI